MSAKIQELIDELKVLQDEYQGLIANYEARGVENLDYEDTEFYGAYQGKEEMLHLVIGKLEAIK